MKYAFLRIALEVFRAFFVVIREEEMLHPSFGEFQQFAAVPRHLRLECLGSAFVSPIALPGVTGKGKQPNRRAEMVRPGT